MYDNSEQLDCQPRFKIIQNLDNGQFNERKQVKNVIKR